VSPLGPDYIVTTPGVLDAFLSLKFWNECNVVCTFRIGRYLINYLEVFRSERTNENLLMVDDAPRLDFDVFQGPSYHVIIRQESQS
jgi:hypothetical protein